MINYKIIFSGLFLIWAFNLDAQTTGINASGSTIQGEFLDVEMNYSLGQPFGTFQLNSASEEEATVLVGFQIGNLLANDESLGSNVGIGDLNNSNHELLYDSSAGRFVLQGDETEYDLQLMVYNLNGLMVWKGRVNDNVPLENLPKSAFIASLHLSDGRLFLTRKFIR